MCLHLSKGIYAIMSTIVAVMPHVKSPVFSQQTPRLACKKDPARIIDGASRQPRLTMLSQRTTLVYPPYLRHLSELSP